MLWYRSLNSNFSVFPRNRCINGNKQPVKSNRVNLALPYHSYYSHFMALANWNYSVLQDKKTLILQPYFVSDRFLFTNPLASYVKQIKTFYTQISVFNKFSYQIYQMSYPILETWRKLMVRIIWKFGNFKMALRLRFRGKGYYLYKSRRNTLSFRFGYSHRVYRYRGIIWYRLLSKTEILIWGRAIKPIWFFAWSIKKIRPFNQYTGKGIRFSRQITYRKLGKIGSYR